MTRRQCSFGRFPLRAMYKASGRLRTELFGGQPGRGRMALGLILEASDWSLPGWSALSRLAQHAVAAQESNSVAD
jgi:hypothetical protein